MLDYAALAALSEVIHLGSFDAAARALRVTPSAVSQRIKTLEERMGTVLVRRANPCTATEAGARLLRHLDQVRLLEQALGPDPAPVRLRIAVNADSLATWFLPALAGQGAALFDLVVDDQDHSDAWLRRGDVLAAVTAQPGPVSGCDTRPLGSLRYLATASPGFVARWFGDGVTARTLSEAPALRFNLKDRLQSDWAVRLTGQSPDLRTHTLPSAQGFVEASVLGLGWGLNPESLVADHIAAGRLVALAPLPLDVALHWQSLRMMAGPLAPLTAAVRAAAARTLIRA